MHRRHRRRHHHYSNFGLGGKGMRRQTEGRWGDAGGWEWCRREGGAGGGVGRRWDGRAVGVGGMMRVGRGKMDSGEVGFAICSFIIYIAIWAQTGNQLLVQFHHACSRLITN